MAEYLAEQPPARLDIRADGDVGDLRFEFFVDGESVAGPVHHPSERVGEARRLAADLGSEFFAYTTNDVRVFAVATSFVDAAIPVEVTASIRKWNGAAAESTLIVETADAAAAELPWELISAALERGLFVVRSVTVPAGKEPGLHNPAMVLAGWSMLPNGVSLPGVVAEVVEIPEDLDDEALEVTSLHSPTVPELTAVIADVDPAIVHLAVANGFGPGDPAPDGAGLEHRNGSFVRLDPGDTGYTKGGGGTPQQLRDDQFLDILRGAPGARLVVLNTMPNPPAASSAMHRLVASLGHAVVGWSGMIEDSIAADFTRFFYQRLVEGESLVDAVRGFTRQFQSTQWVAGAMPTVWVPSERWLAEPVIGADEADEQLDDAPPTRRHDRVPRRVPSGRTPRTDGELDIAIDFRPHESLFPSLLINGFGAVRSLTVTASDECMARLEISCDTGAGESTYSRFQELKVGPTTIDVREIGFPVLYEMLQSNEPRIVNFRVTVSIDGELKAQTTRSVRWRARREWLDSEASHPYLPAFVLPMSRGVGELIRSAAEILLQIAGPKEAFSGYGRDPEERHATADRHVQAIYQALRGWGLKYVTPPGTPVYVPDPLDDPDKELDEQDGATSADRADAPGPSGQLVRLPDDIVDRGHATCHDLALFMAAAIEYVNLRPVLVLLSGHTLVGYWRDSDEHDAYWSSSTDAVQAGTGAAWQLSPAALAMLVDRGDVVLIETTLTTNPTATYEQAKRRGAKFVEKDPTVAIDVRRSRHMIQPLSFG